MSKLSTILSISTPIFDPEINQLKDCDHIRFRARQQSFSRLAGELITKSGVRLDSLVIDDNLSEEEDESDAQLDLTCSRSSELLFQDFMKLDEGRLYNIATTEPTFNFTNDFSDVDLVSSTVLKYLQNNNAKRWKRIGYVPSPSLITA